ncbi:hypothetical protein U1Q18_014310 [Sarracenia purpurea var. burkii]
MAPPRPFREIDWQRRARGAVRRSRTSCFLRSKMSPLVCCKVNKVGGKQRPPPPIAAFFGNGSDKTSLTSATTSRKTESGRAIKAECMATLSSNNAGGGGSWSVATNWTVASGSLGNSIAFESSDSPFASETVDAKGKSHLILKPPSPGCPGSHLILKPPSPGCAPCEIKISFTQEHEIRQVYVWSTAQVYEIYFAPSLQSTNEYLCTVCCGIAARDDEVLHTIDSNELAGAHSMGYAGDKIEEVVSDDGNLASNSDDWVEVKVPDSQLQDNQHNAMPGKVDASPETSIQGFYEAIAEITDADGCISLTLRLISLQSRGCLYVDEIYLFADLVESADSETQFTNSAGSSLMAMLVPALLQLSRNGNDQRHDKHASTTSEKREYLEVESGATDLTNVVNEIQQEESILAPQDVELQEMNEETPEICQVQIPTQVSDREQRYNFVAKTDVPHDNIERALKQLVSRMIAHEKNRSRLCLLMMLSLLQVLEMSRVGLKKTFCKFFFKSSSAPCAVDFELPILDVKFACETSSANSPLEVLLTNLPKVDVKAPLVKQSDHRVIDSNSAMEDEALSESHTFNSQERPPLSFERTTCQDKTRQNLGFSPG